MRSNSPKESRKVLVDAFPKAIEIQTSSYCNGKCVICPHEAVSKEMPNGVMKMPLFNRLLDEIGERKVLIIPYLNSEPLLDPDFFERAALIRKRCPNAKIEVSTNLSLMGAAELGRLKKFRIDELRLSVFGFTKETYERMMPGLSWDKVKANLDRLAMDSGARKAFKKITLVMIEFNLVGKKDISLAREYCSKWGLKFNLWGFLDRAGNVGGFSNEVYKKSINGCSQSRPSERLHVLFDGTVVLCCQDWRRSCVIGNLNGSTIYEIWNSTGYQKVRNSICNNMKDCPAICRRCKLAL